MLGELYLELVALQGGAGGYKEIDSRWLRGTGGV